MLEMVLVILVVGFVGGFGVCFSFVSRKRVGFSGVFVFEISFS